MTYDLLRRMVMHWTSIIQYYVRSQERIEEVPMKSISEDRWLSIDEISEYLGIKRNTIYKWIGRKCMPAHKLGSLWKFKKDEVDDWIRNGNAAEPRESQKPR